MELREAYLRQARSDLRVYELLRAQDALDYPSCHSLHYLQMATEKLAKAVLLSSKVPGSSVQTSHVAFSQIPAVLGNLRDAGRILGYDNHAVYKRFMTDIKDLCRRIDELNPSVGPSAAAQGADTGANCEYPWKARGPDGEVGWQVPAEWDFGLEQDLSGPLGSRLVRFIQRLSERFDQVFR